MQKIIITLITRAILLTVGIFGIWALYWIAVNYPVMSVAITIAVAIFI
jgi:hypothetical protein